MKRIKSPIFLICLYSSMHGMDLSQIHSKFHPKTPAAKQLYAQAQKLIESKTDLNASQGAGGPLLTQAALSNEHAATAILLLSHGAHPDVIDHLGKTPLLYAAEKCAHHIINALVHYDADPNHPCYNQRANKITPLHALCEPHQDSFCSEKIIARQHAIEWLLAAHADTNAKDATGQTPLFALVSGAKGTKSSVLFSPENKNLFFDARKSLIHVFLACKANLEIVDHLGNNLHHQNNYLVDSYLSIYIDIKFKQRREKLRGVLLTFLRTSKNKPEAESPFKTFPGDILKYILRKAYP